MQNKHPVTGQYTNRPVNAVRANIPVVIGGPVPPPPPTSKGVGPVPENAANNVQRSEFVKEGARRSTETGGSMLARAEEAAREQGLTIYVGGVDPLQGL